MQIIAAEKINEFDLVSLDNNGRLIKTKNKPFYTIENKIITYCFENHPCEYKGQNTIIIDNKFELVIRNCVATIELISDCLVSLSFPINLHLSKQLNLIINFINNFN